MKTVHAVARPCLRTASLLLAAMMLAGCGLLGGGDKTAEEGKQEEGSLARVLRMVGAVKDKIDDKESSSDASSQDGIAPSDDHVPEALGRMLEGMAGAIGGAASGNDVRTAEGIEQEGRDLEEIMQRMKETGDLSQAGEVMARMMEMTNAMQGLETSAPGSQATSAGAVQAASTEQMRELGGIPVTGSKLTREQEIALFAPQAWGSEP